jgi:hypothetical protein
MFVCTDKLTYGCYSPSTRTVRYTGVGIEPGYGPADMFETLRHEIGHAILHQAGSPDSGCPGHQEEGDCPPALHYIDKEDPK